MFTQMHALYARTQNGPQVSRVTGGCAKVDSANDRSQACAFNAYLQRPYATTVRAADAGCAYGPVFISMCIAGSRQRCTEQFHRLHACQIHCFLLRARRCKDKFANHRIRRCHRAKWPGAHTRSHVQTFAELWSIAIRKRRARDSPRFTNASEIHLPQRGADGIREPQACKRQFIKCGSAPQRNAHGLHDCLTARWCAANRVNNFTAREPAFHARHNATGATIHPEASADIKHDEGRQRCRQPMHRQRCRHGSHRARQPR